MSKVYTEDLTGQRFGSWLVLEKVLNELTRRWFHKCQCDCGTVRIIKTRDLRSGQSSRCDRCRATTHGLSNTNTYRIWQGMIYRCKNPNYKNYKYYGGRGITVCERWHKFENFFQDMGERPKGLSIDRINNNGNYEPGNCRWATVKEQTSNQRRPKRKE